LNFRVEICSINFSGKKYSRWLMSFISNFHSTNPIKCTSNWLYSLYQQFSIFFSLSSTCYDTHFIFTCLQFFYQPFWNYVIWPSELQKLKNVYIVWLGANFIRLNNSCDINFPMNNANRSNVNRRGDAEEKLTLKFINKKKTASNLFLLNFSSKIQHRSKIRILISPLWNSPPLLHQPAKVKINRT
jgi:hypothetical protein